VALVIQNVDLVEDYIPFERPPQNVTLWSAIPRGIVSFIAATVAIDVKPVNDDFLLNLKATLPPNYGYVFMDANVTISQSTAFSWTSSGSGVNLNLQNFYRANGSASGGLSCNWAQEMVLSDPSQNFQQASMSVIQPWPSFPMIAPPGFSGILANLSAGNSQDLVTLGGVVDAYMSFWQFDLEQIRKYPINSPFPTHAR